MTGTSDRGMGGGPMSGPMATALTDAEILQVFKTSNDGEIVTSNAVVRDAQNADARAYAQERITMRTALNGRTDALSVDPRDDQVSASMRQNATAKAAEIDRMQGAMQDMTYVEAQVVLHGHTLDMLNNVLIPNARDPQVRALLTEARPSVQDHFERAKRLHHDMMMAM